MDYTLHTTKEKTSLLGTLKKLAPLVAHERTVLIYACIAIFLNSGLNLLGPYIVGYTIDHFIALKDYHGIVLFSGILLVVYLGGFLAGYIQTKFMGGVAQRMLFTLRNNIFNKLQELPVAFFNQNKTGDLISRINNDTDKLNQFFSQSLMQLIGSLFVMLGAGVFILCINWRLGLVALAPAALLFIFTRIISPWIKKKNAVNLTEGGLMSAEIQESLNNFKVTVAFNRRDYFRETFRSTNEKNFTTAVSAGLANNIFAPIYGFFANIAQLAVLSYGIYLITQGHFTLGFLISFLLYVTRFYDPLRQLATLWSSFQIAMTGWDRISDILSMKNNITVITESEKDNGKQTPSNAVLEFKNVSFGYPNGKAVLHDCNFSLEKGKTYALVGPTGGGKTTTASLMARLYDPTIGTVFLEGRDIRTYTPEERTQKIGFILQEPFLFTGTVGENIRYGNAQYSNHQTDELKKALTDSGLDHLLIHFEKGLDTEVSTNSEAISLGQRQLIAFIRAVLRNPALLILDEATANIDTVTEQLLDVILKKLPKETTLVIIAHRLNTIENADDIFFVNGGEIIRSGSMEQTVDLLLQQKRTS